MSSLVDVANNALGYVGSSQRIATLTDDSTPANACNTFIDTARRELLGEGYWDWACKSALLALQLDQATVDATGLIAPGWRFVYSRPADCVKPRAVTNSYGLRQFPMLAYWYSDSAPIFGPIRPPWQQVLGADGESTSIVTDLEQAFLIYTADVSNTDVMDDFFKDAFAWLLAIKITGMLKTNAAILKACNAGYQMAKAKAMAKNLNRQQPDREAESPSIQVRG